MYSSDLIARNLGSAIDDRDMFFEAAPDMSGSVGRFVGTLVSSDLRGTSGSGCFSASADI